MLSKSFSLKARRRPGSREKQRNRRRPRASSVLTSHLVEQPLFGFKTNRTTHRVDERARQFASSIVPIVRHAREIRRPLPGRDGRVARAVASSLCSYVSSSSSSPPSSPVSSLLCWTAPDSISVYVITISLSLSRNKFFF